MTRDRLGMVWAGLGLIGLGLTILVASLFGWAKMWPLFPILAGLGFYAAAIAGTRDDGLVFVGTAAILSGLFLFGFTLGIWEWEDMATLWPVFLLIAGTAFLVSFLAERRSRDLGVLGLGCAAWVAGLVGLGFTHGYVGMDLIKYWPLLLVLVGLFMLVGVLFRVLRRE